MKKILLLLICSILLLPACGKVNQPVVQVNNVNSNQNAVILDTAKHNLAFEQALNNIDANGIKANLNYTVDFVVNESEGQGCTLRDEMTGILVKSKEIYDFNQNQEIVQKVKQNTPSFKGLIVGANENYILVYSLNSDNKVDKIFHSNLGVMRLDEPTPSSYSIEQNCKLYPDIDYLDIQVRGMYLSSISDFKGEAFAKISNVDNDTIKIIGKLSDLAGGKFYQAWLTGEDKNAAMLSLGKLVKDGDFYLVTYENVPNKDLRKVIISEESTSDNKIEKAVMQGVFEK